MPNTRPLVCATPCGVGRLLRSLRIAAGCLAAVVAACPWIAYAADAPPKLTAFVLGKPGGDATLGRYENSDYLLAATGRDGPDNADHGSFAGLETDEPSFTFIARLAKAPAGTDDPQYGLSIRAGVEGIEKSINLRYDGRSQFRSVAWSMRHQVTPSTHDGSNRGYRLAYDRELTALEGKWLRIVRRYPYVYLATSDDGRAWRELGSDYLKVLLPQKVWVGLRLIAGGDGKQTVTATFDQISFSIDKDQPGVERQADYREYLPKAERYRMHLAKVADSGRGGKGGESSDATAYVVLPEGMKPADIRAVFYTPGNKEESAGGKLFEWHNEGNLRRPLGMEDWEGVWPIADMQLRNRILAHYGLVRVAGTFAVEKYEAAAAALARQTGIAQLAYLPMVSMGASATGGAAARSAAFSPARTIACSPTLIGMAGANTTDPRVLATPHLYIVGSRDGGHLGDALRTIPGLRDRHALFGVAPMWRVYHRTHRSFGLMLPYFLEVMRLRLPEGHDYAKAPAELRPIKEEDGWLGLVDTWETNYPQVVRLKEHRGGNNVVWLPTELTARLWQAFCTENPRTLIHFPTFDGFEGYGRPDPRGWHNSTLKAGEPVELVASGPLGKQINVEYYSGLRKLKVVKGQDYRVTLEGLEPGYHAIYAITTVDGQKEISRPVCVMVFR